MGSLIEEIYHTLKHARTFIGSREKMHPEGIQLYDELLSKVEDIVTHPTPQMEGGEARTKKL